MDLRRIFQVIQEDLIDASVRAQEKFQLQTIEKRMNTIYQIEKYSNK